jgi:hypothetical protein
MAIYQGPQNQFWNKEQQNRFRLLGEDPSQQVQYSGPMGEEWTDNQKNEFRNKGIEPTQVQGESNTNFGSMTNILGYGGAIANPLLSYLQGIGGGGAEMVGDYQRFREKEVDEALVQNLSNRDALQNQSPEATRIAKANALQMGKANAINAASSAGASAMANSGMGGDMNSALIAGIQQAAPVVQASQGYDQALSNTFTEREAQQANLNQQIGQNTMDRGVLADMTAYHYAGGSGSQGLQYSNVLDYLVGGQDKGMQIADMLRGDGKQTAKVKEPK